MKPLDIDIAASYVSKTLIICSRTVIDDFHETTALHSRLVSTIAAKDVHVNSTDSGSLLSVQDGEKGLKSKDIEHGG